MNKQSIINLENFSRWMLNQGYSRYTIRSICHTLERFSRWVASENITIENIGYNDILSYIQYLKQRGNKQRTQQITIQMLEHYYNYLQSQKAVSQNPASFIQIKGIRRKTIVEILTPEELEAIYQGYETGKRNYPPGKIVPPQQNFELSRKRNKIILGLIIYQGLRKGELSNLELEDLHLKEGTIHIKRGRVYNERKLTLASQQVYEMIEYVSSTRKQILLITKMQTNKLFINRSGDLNNIMQRLIENIQLRHTQLKNFKQIRRSVITNWLKNYNLRQVQYFCGHRYLSSTEEYQLNNLESLQEDINKYHPIE